MVQIRPRLNGELWAQTKSVAEQRGVPVRHMTDSSFMKVVQTVYIKIHELLTEEQLKELHQ